MEEEAPLCLSLHALHESTLYSPHPFFSFFFFSLECQMVVVHRLLYAFVVRIRKYASSKASRYLRRSFAVGWLCVNDDWIMLFPIALCGGGVSSMLSICTYVDIPVRRITSESPHAILINICALSHFLSSILVRTSTYGSANPCNKWPKDKIHWDEHNNVYRLVCWHRIGRIILRHGFRTACHTYSTHFKSHWVARLIDCFSSLRFIRNCALVCLLGRCRRDSFDMKQKPSQQLQQAIIKMT